MFSTGAFPASFPPLSHTFSHPAPPPLSKFTIAVQGEGSPPPLAAPPCRPPPLRRTPHGACGCPHYLGGYRAAGHLPSSRLVHHGPLRRPRAAARSCPRLPFQASSDCGGAGRCHQTQERATNGQSRRSCHFPLPQVLGRFPVRHVPVSVQFCVPTRWVYGGRGR